MRKICSIICLVFAGFSATCQVDTLTAEEKMALDSILNQDEFMKMLLESRSPKSYGQIKAGIGNSYFSIKNKRINATQLENKIVYTATALYSHKSGLGISAMMFLSDFERKSGIYQYCITPTFNYGKNKYFEATASYTRYFRKKGFEIAASPVQNEFFVIANLKKPWLKPGISSGYANGKTVEYKLIDTVLFGVRRVFIDTMTVKLSSFSLSSFVSHTFEWYQVLNKYDGIAFIPTVYLNAGSDQYDISHRNRLINKLNERPDRVKNAGTFSGGNDFVIQSIAAGLDFNYLVKKFGIRAQSYFDYYLPETTDQRFTAIFSFTISYSFYKK
jgi:hypothetical protein